MFQNLCKMCVSSQLGPLILTKVSYSSRIAFLQNSISGFSGTSSNFAARKMSRLSNEHANRLIWVDLEMTGLDPDRNKIMEAAVIVTDKDLNIIAQSKNIVLNVSEEELDNMDEWCKKTHRETGLTAECKLSSFKVEEVDSILANFVQQHTPKGKCPLAGNSVSYDRSFMKKYLPKLESHMHYRIVDVSSIKELLRLWNPALSAQAPKKKMVHRALDDILESIGELRFYKETLFLPKSSDSKSS